MYVYGVDMYMEMVMDSDMYMCRERGTDIYRGWFGRWGWGFVREMVRDI